jgi:hypothetical protein
MNEVTTDERLLLRPAAERLADAVRFARSVEVGQGPWVSSLIRRWPGRLWRRWRRRGSTRTQASGVGRGSGTRSSSGVTSCRRWGRVRSVR